MRNLHKMMLVCLALLLALGAAIAQADGPIIWKAHCARHHDLQIMPDGDGDGVHVLCVRAAQEGIK